MNRKQVEDYFKPFEGVSYVSAHDGMQFANNILQKKGRLLEIGTGAGHSTGFLSKLLPGWNIYTIDDYGLCDKENKIGHAREISEISGTLDLPNVIQIVGDSKRINWELPLDALFIDGDHSFEGCKGDYDKYFPFLKKGGLVFFHDYWREDLGVKRFVDGLKCQKIELSKMAVIRK
jgi:predicted O-methyltransferase YrrM